MDTLATDGKDDASMEVIDEPHLGEEECHEMIFEFLRRMSEASQTLATLEGEGDQTMMDASSETAQQHVEIIARNLLQACQPTVLASGVNNLPSVKLEETDFPQPDDDDDVLVKPYIYRRPDYLRQVLRLLAPISMDIAAHVCSIALSSQDSSSSSSLQALILFSYWLPVAPHLAAMATDLFQTLQDPFAELNTTKTNALFICSEACYNLCSFYSKCGNIDSLRGLADWSFLFHLLRQDVEMSDAEMNDAGCEERFSHASAIRWYSARCVGHLLDWKAAVMSDVLEKAGLHSSHVPWRPHSWTIDQEELDMQRAQFRRSATVWGSSEFLIPSTQQVQEFLNPSTFLARVANGLCFYKDTSIVDAQNSESDSDAGSNRTRKLIQTPTTCRNLSLVGAALCQHLNPAPILICGPQGSGKSSLVRELLRLCRPKESLLEFHVDEETDSKTLIGSYTTTDIPGEFAWRAGPLTHATREGRWVLLEDVDSVPVEIQAALVKLLKDRVLPLGSGKYERCHPNFRLFGTCSTVAESQRHGESLRIAANRGGGKKVFNPSLWRKVHVRPLPYSELKQVAMSLHPNMPPSVVESAVDILQSVDRSGRALNSGGSTTNDSGSDVGDAPEQKQVVTALSGGREPSVRDFFKLLSRISNGVSFEKGSTFTTESQRTLCMAESVDIFVGSCPDRHSTRDFVTQIAAVRWGISKDLAQTYVESRRPSLTVGADFVDIGRARIHVGSSVDSFHAKPSNVFAQTKHALRLMESVGVSLRENEPVLLVGETGCGKTTMIQQLATICSRELLVQNLSLQTDSTDLLGGYKPLDLKTVARKVYGEFVDLFVSTFSRKQNTKFLKYASSMLEKSNWKKLSQCFQRAADLGTAKMAESTTNAKKTGPTFESWNKFSKTCERFERQRLSCDSGLAFTFSEGVLVDAIVNGKWVLLDEINLASSETLQRLCGLLDDPSGSVTLTERGDASAIIRHPNFRLFAAMNPATDAGKKDLPPSIRSRFSELYVDELLDPVELRVIASRYLDCILPNDGKPPENAELVVSAVAVYLKCRELAEKILVDGSGHKPRYTLRTLSRALSAAKQLILQQRLPRNRALYEGFQLSFECSLDAASIKTVRKLLKSLLPADVKKSDLEHPGKRPSGKNDADIYTLVKPFWIKAGPSETVDWSEASSSGNRRFILTPSMALNLRRLTRALAAGNWPILLEGPTSAGKTTLVEYIATRCGHRVVRINNHEHTDIQEYTGSFAADSTGSLSFRDGLLVRALRFGHWVILDELNLAPSEVLEALNRLLDDNRELFLSEINETVKPHPNFRLFATQNPCGAYGGRKPLSRAFRNRFVEIHMGDIPNSEMKTILEQKCGCPPSHAKYLVDIMVSLRQRRSKSNMFLGKDSLITPRDLLRWAERRGATRQEIAEQGFMLLAERLRSTQERDLVQDVLEDHLKVTLKMEEKYYGTSSKARKLLAETIENSKNGRDDFFASIAPTTSLLRLISIVLECMKQKEPVLLVGDTGCGKTTVVQFLSYVVGKKLHIVNCHATTETSDLLGGLRPVRGRHVIASKIVTKLRRLIAQWPHQNLLEGIEMPAIVSSEKVERGASFQNITMEECEEGRLDAADVALLLRITRDVAKARPSSDRVDGGAREIKRRKLTPDGQHECSDSDTEESLKSLIRDIEELGQRYHALFEWSDGPLVHAMKAGELLLLDEMSLAEDAVLERLNSVLEPSRTLVLAEKGETGPSSGEIGSSVIVAEKDFQIFATMNPGGDFGKRELSPALRSRFTEIWVPPVAHRADFEIVLSRAMLPRSLQEKSQTSLLHECILTYVDWFNSTICGDPSSPYFGHSLTLRDVLSWARFIVASRSANENLDIWDAYRHGARLMHLDGLGLGSGLPIEEASSVRKRAEGFLAAQLPDGIGSLDLDGAKESLGVHTNERFGASPFFIQTGTRPTRELRFNLDAPTTSHNMFRVLRAMQVRKPVLLEGSPGVGKTSLISALAMAAGHKLVRINLSEQTDISDLMGSDLPMQSSTAGGASFEWCDGVLLTAIKEGSWVLLDELNLASQSVLEGLNSCLDHRAEVFIPELGRTFTCPETFRVFAAQNPLAQGGGRKGLPRSFLNRFTKVFVSSLSDCDLRAIVCSNYPTFDSSLVHRMIDFNNEVHNDVVAQREYGFEGSPWEFNLRDIFRWCDLVSARASSLEANARDLYYQRFRTETDRNRLDATFQKHFGRSMKKSEESNIRVLESYVEVGDSTLKRQPLLHGGPCSPLWRESSVSLSRQLPVEAVARCIECQWPCLLVGQAGSGKAALVTSLAEACNTNLVTQCLTPSSDVTELVGCFEQLDGLAEERRYLEDLCRVAEEFIIAHPLDCDKVEEVWSLLLGLKRIIVDQREDSELCAGLFRKNDPVHTMALDLARLLYSDAVREKALSKISMKRLGRITSRLQNWNQGQENDRDDSGGHFVWCDGPLVEAMEMGYWLLLENVNLCPSSVLDRLNSVMEQDGELLLSECGPQGSSKGEASHRRVKPHQNFRIFLSMDPANGEVSRAMRNRCVEIALLGSQGSPVLEAGRLNMSNREKIDCLGLLQNGGIRSIELASLILSIFSDEQKKSSAAGEEHPCLSEVVKSSFILDGLVSQGYSSSEALRHFLQLSLQISEETVSMHLARQLPRSIRSLSWTPLPPSLQIRPAIVDARLSTVAWEARLLRTFWKPHANEFSALSCPKLALLEAPFEGAAKAYNVQPDELKINRCDVATFRDVLAQLYLERATPADFDMRHDHFEGVDSSTSATISWMASFMKNELVLPSHDDQLSGESSSAASSRTRSTWFSFPANIRQLQFGRLCQRLREWKWFRAVSTRHVILEGLQGMRVLETSFYMHESLLDRSSLVCPVLPSLYPFFVSVDRFIYLALYDSIRPDIDNDASSMQSFAVFMDTRDRLWCLLAECPLSLRTDLVFSFEESEFIAQWKWLRKSFRQLASERYISILGNSARIQLANLQTKIESIDRAVFGSGLGMSIRTLQKRTIRPRLPREASHWESIFEVRELSENGTVLCDPSFTRDEASVNLDVLVDCYHPLLFTTSEERFQLLTALCTLHWSWTDEGQSEKSVNGSAFSGLDFGAQLKQLFQKKREAFVSEVARAKVDLSISTVENQLSAESLEGLKEMSTASISSSEAHRRLGKSLLSTFQRLQVSGLAEFWCAHEETSVCSDVCAILCNSSDPRETRRSLSRLVPRIKRLVDTVLTRTVWSISDMRPLQTLIWILEGSSKDELNAEALLRCLLPAILFSRSRHLFLNSFARPGVISENLELPNMWEDDETTTRRFQSRKEGLMDDNFVPFGSQMLQRQCRSEFLLRNLGGQFSLSHKSANAKIQTMENSAFRHMQYRDVTEILSYSPVFPSSKDLQLSITHFLLTDILRALKDTSCAGEVAQMLERLNVESLLQLYSNGDPISLKAREPINPQLQRLVVELVSPLVESFVRATNAKEGSKEREEHSALACIYTGLVRLNILKPDSPLDPGREPIAKVTLISRKLEDTKLRLTANRLQRGFMCGDFSPFTDDCCPLVDEIERLTEKRKSTAKKVIQRVPNAPHFSELFRETNEFITTAARSDFVLKLARNFRSADDRAAIYGWQRIATVFCQRLFDEYKAFEEFSWPLITSVQMVQDGLNVLAASSLDRCDDDVLGTCRQLMQFPLQSYPEFMQVSTKAFHHVAGMEDTKRRGCHVALGLALLCRVSLKQLQFGLDTNDVATSCGVLSSLIRSQLGTGDMNRDEHGDDLEEREYREQFPDHRQDFKELLEVEDDDKSSCESSIHNENTGSVLGGLTDRQISLLCSVHGRLFSSMVEGKWDAVRTRTFQCAYGAAFELENAFSCMKDLSVEEESLGGHVFAMSLKTAAMTGHARVDPHLLNSSSSIDFHNDPLPSEAVLAAEPLEKLAARVTQLLTAFPGHSILLGIGRICEKVRKFDLTSTPIGKVMTGLEVVLKHAQGWEQHASDKVRLGIALEAVAQIVAKWRKLELESWPNLLQARQMRHINRTRKHWMRLHQVLFEDPSAELEAVVTGVSAWRLADFPSNSPKWVWKGVSTQLSALLSKSDSSGLEDLSELVKTIDTFVLTSSLGDFEERLRILNSFSIQLIYVYNLSGGRFAWRLQQARVVHSFWAYYSQFRTFLAAKLTALRKPLEKELNDEVKLAKWDEQSYYALAESTERNHRKLMKILTKYDDCLELNVGVLIQEETCQGVRSDPNSEEEVSSSVPTERSLFPLVNLASKSCRSLDIKSLGSSITTLPASWADPGQLGAAPGDHVQKIKQYAKKMISMMTKGIAISDSWGSVGSVVTSSISTAIFDRIEALRAKSSRPMKERALVDLFRELKSNGFSTTKWSVPSEARKMEQIFQLPAPNLSGIHCADLVEQDFVRAEKYYLRCLVEIHAFRSEVKMHGSRHMTTRQMELMMNLCNSGVFMLTQQRCLVSGVIRDVTRLAECSAHLSFEQPNLPMPQSGLRRSVRNFDDKLRSAIESIAELSLFIKSSQALLEGNKLSWARDAIAKLESIGVASSATDRRTGDLEVIRWDHLERVSKDHDMLARAELIVQDCQSSCQASGCLPSDVFEVAAANISEAINASSQCTSSLERGRDLNSAECGFNSLRGALSVAVERALISFQGFSTEASGCKGAEESASTDSVDASVRECHNKLINAWDKIQLARLNDAMNNVLQFVVDELDKTHLQEQQRECCLLLVSNTSFLSRQVLSLAETLLVDSVRFLADAAKLNYILLRLYRVLVAKGFCSDKVTEGDDDAEGDISGMTFEDDQDGTGMGEGEGKTDVTDQLESEEQLLGLKSDNDNENMENRESKTLNEEEAEQGMEMENDFDGETYDLPEKQDMNESDNEDEGAEELDRQMGDEASPDEQVVDEKMWNESDDEDGINEDEEKFEKDTNVEGEAIEGETRTKDDDDTEKKNSEDAKEKSSTQANEDGEENDTGEAENEPRDDANNEDGDQYEDNHGIEVRDEGQEEPQNTDGDDDGMNLQDDMCLDEENEQDEQIGDENPDEGDEAQDAHSVETEQEGEGDPQGLQEDENEDHGEREDAQPMSISEADLDPKEEEIEAGGDGPEESMDENPVESSDHQSAAENAHGIQGSEGVDTVMEEDQEGAGDEQGEDAAGGNSGNAQSQMSENNGNGADGYSERNENLDPLGDTQKKDKSMDIPNPFRDPGDASKFWHRKLDVVEASEEHDESTNTREDQDETQEMSQGEFQFSSADQQSTTQVLGETIEEEAVELDRQNQEESQESENLKENETSEEPKDDTAKAKHEPTSKVNKDASQGQAQAKERGDDDNDDTCKDDNGDIDEVVEEKDDSSRESATQDDEKLASNVVVSDMSKLAMDVDEAEVSLGNNMRLDEQVSGISSAEAAEARAQWLQIQGETHSLSRRLCEKLRLVMEPLVASKLRGDYRSGKRINMKRVIGYIASGYRKDKIWLRRTKPAKRDYRVLLAVDDSESMRKSGAGNMALRAMATLAVGMNQLEIGQLGVASFGDDMKLLHPFNLPFTSESGADMVMNCQFDQPRTRISLCVESAIACLESFGDRSSMQLVFLISDGRIERDSRAAVKRLVREMVDRNILLAMIIVEGDNKKKDSIVNMKEVTFEKGKPVVKQFIDDYPFPYYIILEDLTTLPEVMGDALRQWFEMLAQLKQA